MNVNRDNLIALNNIIFIWILYQWFLNQDELIKWMGSDAPLFVQVGLTTDDNSHDYTLSQPPPDTRITLICINWLGKLEH